MNKQTIDAIVGNVLSEIKAGRHVRPGVEVKTSRDERENIAAIIALYELSTLFGYGIEQTDDIIKKAVSRGIKAAFTADEQQTDYQLTRWKDSGPTLRETVSSLVKEALAPHKELHNPAGWAMSAIICSALNKKAAA